MKCGLNNLAILVDAKVKHSFEVELFNFFPSHIGGCHIMRLLCTANDKVYLLSEYIV